jgi:hypothetical protein
MIEMTCATCGEKTQVQSLLTAAQQPCLHCGHLLMGGAAPGGSKAAWSAPSSSGLWLGVIAGIFVGIMAVVGVRLMGRAVPVPVQGALFGALAALLLSPIVAISSFLSMVILPFSLEAILGDNIWNRIAKANSERRLGPLFIPFLLLVVLPMSLGAFGGSRLTVIETPLVMGATLGAILLGALLGAVAGSLLGGRQQHA